MKGYNIMGWFCDTKIDKIRKELNDSVRHNKELADIREDYIWGLQKLDNFIYYGPTTGIFRLLAPPDYEKENYQKYYQTIKKKYPAQLEEIEKEVLDKKLKYLQHKSKVFDNLVDNMYRILEIDKFRWW